ncbi:deleted in lung and esophageal cancer protein 1 [Eublepharis macularius]|uniref:Deleted in lung and esophageal cancer protein 1 n=1 Tax=Eublepharis macularius TaxID=481883 RepID=A0AA97K277_EUBMA|nr:deleted in lung and esophageal cancer protein 1 [Eublepharis macularius]
MLPSRDRAVSMVARQSPEPPMGRHRPASELTQDISHLLASMFKNMYTSEVIGKDTVENMIKSRGGDNASHEKFVEELQKVHTEYKDRMMEAEMLERHIIQARARATAEEERVLALNKMSVPEAYQNIGLPPVQSSFERCVDDELLKKHNLIGPGDYITDPIPITQAPKDKSEPGYLGENLSFKQRISEHAIFKESKHVKKILDALPEVSLSSVTLESSTSEIPDQVRRPSCKKSSPSRKLAWKNDMPKTERDEARAYLKKLDERHNFLRNPRFFPPNSLHGGKSLIWPQKKVQRTVAGKQRTVVESNIDPVPIFLSNPPAVLFSYYEVGQVYEMTIELQNMTSTSQTFRIIPPATSAFAIGLGKFPGEGGIVAPGMSCHYTIQFMPEHLAGYEDYILVETQSPYPLLIPLEGRRPPPILTLPQVLDCGACLVGGLKFSEFLCKNEGVSSGKFCIMPKAMWPPPQFRAVAMFGFVEQEPFGIQPAVFELFPGQSVVMETAFFPSFPGAASVTYIIACDNCQINEITVTGIGQLISLQLLSVTGGEGSVTPGELVDITSQHFVRFDSLNPYSTSEKTLVIRNVTHVDLPFYWQIMKPNLQPVVLEGDKDLTKIKYNLETDSAFSITPATGVLQPHADHPFTLRYFPQKLKEYHSVLQIVLKNIPEPPSLQKQKECEYGEIHEEDVIALEIDVKGQTEPFQLLLAPYSIVIPGEHYIGVNIRRSFRMRNNSKSSVKFTWGKIIECDILQVEPYTGKLGPYAFQDFEFVITGGKPGHSIHDLPCKIRHCAEPVILHVEADFKGPVLSINVPSLNLGLIKLGEVVMCKFEITNLSQLPGRWKLQESPACLAERNEEVSPFTANPSSGELSPLGNCSVSVLFRSYICQSLQTVLELEVENGKASHIPVFVEVQTPRVCLLSSSLHFDELFLGTPARATVVLFNQRLLPAHYEWGELLGSQSSSCIVSISPESGLLAPNEEKEFCVELIANSKEELTDLTVSCCIEDMLEPLFLSISGQVKGLHITYAIPFERKQSVWEQPSEPPLELMLDFGSEVPLKSVVKRQLIITNHTAIDAPFTIEADYFSSCPPPSEEPGSNVVDMIMEKTKRVTRQIAKRKQSAFRAALLSHGKGLAFHVHPSEGTMKAFQELTVEITAYNNMWGEYQDNLVCKVGDLEPKLIPVQIAVKGCPIFLQVTGPNHFLQTPVVRFGAHISGGDTVSRYIRLNNPTPFDIRMDWESYNQDKDDDKLVDLLVFYGAPFPIKDMDGNEIESLREEKTPTDQTPYASSCTTPTSYRGGSNLNPIAEVDEDGSSSDESEELLISQKIISVVLRPHEGVPSDYPFCITPKQIVIPAGGAASIRITFTPLMLPEIINKFECEGFALGFMSLDSEDVQEIPGKVTRADGHGVPPLRIDLQAFVKPALLTVETDHEHGLEFHALASSLIPDEPCKGVLTDAATTINLKLTNNTETPLHFKLILTPPFSISGVDPKKSLVTPHRDSGENQIILCALQNMLVKVSFHTTLELLTYQHLPDDQMFSGLQVLQGEKGDKILEFKKDLLIEYGNKATQVLPMTAYLTVPVLELSRESIDFGTCLVNQTRCEAVLLMNKGGCRSYWAALLEEAGRHSEPEVFSISPSNGILEAHCGGFATKTHLVVHFTARDDVDYETTVMVVGMLGEKPCNLHVRGKGSHDEKYEARRQS